MFPNKIFVNFKVQVMESIQFISELKFKNKIIAHYIYKKLAME